MVAVNSTLLSNVARSFSERSVGPRDRKALAISYDWTLIKLNKVKLKPNIFEYIGRSHAQRSGDLKKLVDSNILFTTLDRSHVSAVSVKPLQ